MPVVQPTNRKLHQEIIADQTDDGSDDPVGLSEELHDFRIGDSSRFKNENPDRDRRDQEANPNDQYIFAEPGKSVPENAEIQQGSRQ